MSEERPPGRIRLADLMTWVLGAGIAAAVCREAYPATGFAPPMDLGRILGLAAAILAIFMGIGLFRQIVAQVQRRHAEGGWAWLIAVAWRLAVLGLLGAALVAEASLLRGDAGLLRGNALGDDCPEPQVVRLRLLPLAVTLALAGILAGLVPGRDQGRERPRRMAWLSVVLAAVAGVIIAATQAIIPYLVMLAMDAVRNAMTGPVASQALRPRLHNRLYSAGVESSLVLACCLILGLLVARELRRPQEVSSSGRSLFALLTATAAAAAGAAWLLAVTLPRLDDWLAEGLRVVIDPLNAAIIVLGFAGLALGPVARAADRPGRREPDEPRDRPRASFWWILGNLTIALILFDFIAARAIDLIVARRITDGGPVDESWTRWVGWVDAAYNWLQSAIPFERLGPWSLFETPEWLALALTEAWVAWRVASLLVTSIGDESTPIDASLTDRRTVGRFLIRWAALTVLMVASLPASFLAGLALLHTLIRASG